MAYKFQVGKARMSGSLIQEGDLTLSGSMTFQSGESLVIGNASLTEAELEQIDGITAGTAAASKAVVLDGSKDITGINDMTLAGDVILPQSSNLYLAGDGGAAKIVSTGGNAVSIFGAKVVTNGSSIEPDSDGGTDLGSASKQFADLYLSSELKMGNAVITEAELEMLDGITAGTVAASKAVVVDANKDASGFRNVTGTGAITAGTSFVIGSADLNEADMEKLDGITNGTVAASKAVVVDADLDIAGFRNVSGSAQFEMGSLMIGDVFSADAEEGIISSGWDLIIENSSNTEKFSVEASSGAVVSADSITAGTSFVIGSADLNEADMEKLDGITNGTAAASKALVLDASKNIGTIGELSASVLSGSEVHAALDSLHINGTAVTSTAAELNLVDGAAPATLAAGKAVIYHAANNNVRANNFIVNDGSGVGNASLGTLMTFAADGDIAVADGAYDFNIAAHDGTNGLKLGGVLVDASAADLNFTNVAAAGTAEASKAVVLDASKDIAGLNDVSAASITLSDLSDNRIALVGASGLLQDSAEFVYVDSRPTYTGGRNGLVVSSSASGSAYLLDGYASIYDSDGDLVFDASGDYGVRSRVNTSISGASDVGLTVNSTMDGGASMTAVGHIGVGSSGTFEAMMFSTGNISGSGELRGETLNVGAATIVNASRAVQNVTSVDGSGDLTMGTITMSGFSVDADGDTALKSLAVDNSSTIGCDADADIMTLAAQSLALANDVDFNVAKAGGLQIAGTAVTATAAELNLVDGIIAGTVAASKAVIVDSNKDLSGLRHLSVGGILSGSSKFELGGTVQLDGVASAVATAADLVYFRDATDFLMKGDSFADVRDNLIYASVSGDATVAAGGALTIAADAVEPSMINLFDDSLAATNKHILIADGTDYSSFELSGDIRMSNAGVVAIVEDAVEAAMLNDDVISGQTELAADGLAAADELMISDGGTLKKIGVDNLFIDGPGLLTETAITVADDYFMFLDGGATGNAKKESIADLVSAMAGGGLTATNGVLSTQAGDVALIADGGTLAEGYNYLADLGANAGVSLPAAPSVGDVVHVKAADLNGYQVTISKQGSHTIDDDHTSVVIESDFGAVSLVYVVSNKWRLV